MSATTHEDLRKVDTDPVDKRRRLLVVGGSLTTAIGIVAAVTKPWRFFNQPDTSAAQPPKTQEQPVGGRGGGETVPTNIDSPDHITKTIAATPTLQKTLAEFMGLTVLPPGNFDTRTVPDQNGKLPDQTVANYRVIVDGKVLTINAWPAAITETFAGFENKVKEDETGSARRVWGNPHSYGGQETQLYYSHSTAGDSLVGFTHVGSAEERKFQVFARGVTALNTLTSQQRMEQWNGVAGALLRSGALG
ncbi:MAG TPA: hypothetical protein VFB59_04690 [Candidatus Saccharimonadales bacterium]|nr:hypothetical protein [Candidatus Saccharimonadales bacterium]